MLAPWVNGRPVVVPKSAHLLSLREVLECPSANQSDYWPEEVKLARQLYLPLHHGYSSRDGVSALLISVLAMQTSKFQQVIIIAERHSNHRFVPAMRFVCVRDRSTQP